MERGPVSEGNLRFLKVLVTTLTLTMIGGLIAVFAVIVIRFPSNGPMVLPDTLEMPAGTVPEAVTFGPDWIAVVSGDAILVFDRDTGELRRRVDLLE